MRIDRRLVGIGVFLITVGAVMVAVRPGVVSLTEGGPASSAGCGR
jgi:hypothetical protein